MNACLTGRPASSLARRVFQPSRSLTTVGDFQRTVTSASSMPRMFRKNWTSSIQVSV
jgi:hypothetical protein